MDGAVKSLPVKDNRRRGVTFQQILGSLGTGFGLGCLWSCYSLCPTKPLSISRYSPPVSTNYFIT